VIHNKNYFKLNPDIHGNSTTTKSNLHQPLSHLITYQKGTYYLGIKVFNTLPTQIQYLSYNIILFKLTFESYLYFHSYYTSEEYLITIRIKTLNSDMQLCMHI